MSPVGLAANNKINFIPRSTFDNERVKVQLSTLDVSGNSTVQIYQSNQTKFI